MPQLRSGKVVTGSDVKLADEIVTSSSSLAAGIGCEAGNMLVVKQSRHLAPERKPEQPLSCCLQPAMLSSILCKQFAPPAPMQKEQGESSQRLPGKKTKRIQCRRISRINKGLEVPVSDTAICEDWQAATVVAVTCWEKTGRRRTEQGRQQFFSGTTSQNKLLAVIERKEQNSEEPNYSAFQESSGILGEKGKYSFMEIKLQIASSEEEIKSIERHGISCLPEPEVLQPRNSTCSTEVKSTDSIMILKMQIPYLEKAQESLSEPAVQEEVDRPKKSDEYNGIIE